MQIPSKTRGISLTTWNLLGEQHDSGEVSKYYKSWAGSGGYLGVVNGLKRV